MNFIKKHKVKIIITIIITAITLISLILGGYYLSINRITEKEPSLVVDDTIIEPTATPEVVIELSTDEPKMTVAPTSAPKEVANKEKTDLTEKKEHRETPVENTKETVSEEEIFEDNEKEPVSKDDGEEPVSDVDTDREESVEAEEESGELKCTLSVRCDNAVGESDEKSVIIPDDGIIFPEQTVVFYEGESVFNVLAREMKKNKIHLEFVNAPVYNSAYIEGINNLYEYDCGELSGWMYKVNDYFPNYGCSRYELKNGDKIEWVYTCDLGRDVGGEYSARNGMKYE